MGRKTAASSAKSKEKRQQRKEEQQRISKAMSVIAEANKLVDPLEPFPVFQKFNKNGIVADIFIKRSAELGEVAKIWAFHLTKKNMQIKYEQCSWGWNEQKKLEELYDEAAWYLIAKNPVDRTYLGFSHFRFDIDEGIEVLYCYELQLEAHVQRKGLGKFMMQILELVAFKNNMKKVVLTVLKNNQNSKFFKAIGFREPANHQVCSNLLRSFDQSGIHVNNWSIRPNAEPQLCTTVFAEPLLCSYELDESSPIDDEDETYPYEILSKINKRLAPTIPITTNGKHHSHNHHNGHSHGHSHSNGHCCPGHHHH